MKWMDRFKHWYKARSESQRKWTVWIMEKQWDPIKEQLMRAPEEVDLGTVISNKTVLMHAIQQGQQEVFLALIKAGVDVNQRNKLGSTALMRACFKGITWVKTLLEAGALVNAKDGDHETALMCACLARDRDVVQTLLEAGADVNAQNSWGQTALMIAAMENDEEILTLLVQASADVHRQNKDGFSVAMIAAFKGKTSMVKRLIDAGANVHQRSKLGETALTLAAGGGHLESIQIILEAGGDVEHRNQLGKTAREICQQKGWKLAEDYLKAFEVRKCLVSTGVAVEKEEVERSPAPRNRL